MLRIPNVNEAAKHLATGRRNLLLPPGQEIALSIFWSLLLVYDESYYSSRQFHYNYSNASISSKVKNLQMNFRHVFPPWRVFKIKTIKKNEISSVF